MCSYKRYAEQVRLLVRLLPAIAAEEVFALKGGSAINLFYRDMPRLSVDIDLVYLPVESRSVSLSNIDLALKRVMNFFARNNRDAQFQRIAGGGDLETRIMAISGNAKVKIEISPVARGTVLPPRLLKVTDIVEETFGFAEAQVVAFEDLYGSKLHAALDRQHPRDLYDIGLLYENEGMGDDLFRVFLVYVSSSNRPPHELLSPLPVPIKKLYMDEFSGMTPEKITQPELEAVRMRLFTDIRNRLAGDIAAFLLSLHDAEPDFELIGLPEALHLPAVQWKLLNLRKLKAENPKKHAQQRAMLETLFI